VPRRHLLLPRSLPYVFDAVVPFHSSSTILPLSTSPPFPVYALRAPWIAFLFP
jgi:hypothetical protein